MHGLPRPVYDRVHQYAVDIVNASARDDRRAVARVFQRLREHYLRQEARGLRHPFLPETVGDFADEPDVRIGLYRHALDLARRQRLPQQTIFLALGEVQFGLAQVGRARRSLEAARAHAGRNRDAETARRARLLLVQVERRRRTRG